MGQNFSCRNDFVKRVNKFTQNNIKSENFSLDTENWSQGIYFVKITSENALENTLKVIKK